jgi:DNA invertase Pin-like site-specific DNA recombinase
MNTATIYARVSSTGDRQDTARQVEDLTAYANRNDLQLAKVFEEKASGAKSRKERPVLDQCLKYCVTNHVNILLVSELSRLGRNTDDVLQNVIFCKESGLNVYFQKEQFSIFTEDGKPHPFLMIFISILGTIAEMERENIHYRLQSGREKYIRDGGKLGRKEGYRKQPEDYERDYPEVFKHLRKRDRLSYDNIAKLCDVSKHTVITCAKLLEGGNPASQK